MGNTHGLQNGLLHGSTLPDNIADIVLGMLQTFDFGHQQHGFFGHGLIVQNKAAIAGDGDIGNIRALSALGHGDNWFLGGDGAAFVAQSRLIDVLGIMGGCERMYVSAISPVVAAQDAALDSAITNDFKELITLVTETRDREAAGETFTAEEADALGSEAQEIAERIVAQVLQAAAKNGVQIKG